MHSGDSKSIATKSCMSDRFIDYILLHKPKEEHGCNTFVTIAERMVLLPYNRQI